jgi:ketosteroid isomerase-like protein
MSRENVQISQAITAAWNAGDMEAIREMYDSRVVLVPAEGWPEPGPFAGRDAVLGWYQQIQETWDAGTLETLDLTDAGDRIVTRQVWRGIGGRGPDTQFEFATILTIRRGKVVFLELCWDYAEALEAVGLGE